MRSLLQLGNLTRLCILLMVVFQVELGADLSGREGLPMKPTRQEMVERKTRNRR